MKRKPKLNSRTLLLITATGLLTIVPLLRRSTEATPNPAQAEDKFFDVGGYRLHAVLAGQGKPAVVFESGMGDGTDSWDKVQPEISKVTRTLSYDRPGLGKSDKAPQLHDLNQSADELHVLLQKSRVSPPYILVGHSMGGLIVRVFAYRYPSETAGMVLVDPSGENFDDRLHSKLTLQQWQAYLEAKKEHFAIPVMHMDMYGMTSGSEAAAAVPLPSVPKILLSASKLDDVPADRKTFREAAVELPKEWVQKTPDAELVAVPTSEHYIQIVAPEIVIAAIKKVLAENGR